MFVSVVIPCRNEENYISLCVNSVLNNNYPQELTEIIIVDGMSDDNTLNIIKKFTENHNNIHLIPNDEKTTQWALNMGIKKSRGDVIIILGAHAELGENYIYGCVEFLKHNDEVACVGGLVENVFDNENSRIIGLAMSSKFGVGNVHFRTASKSAYVDTVAFGAYKREIFDKIGLFDEDLVRNQDDEFNYRITKNGFKIYLNAELKLRYFVRSSFQKLFNQYFQYGYWKVYVNKKHKTITTLRQIVPSLFVAFLVLGFIASYTGIYMRFLYRLMIFLYIVLSVRSGLYKVDKISELLKFMFSCFILHISYGSGYLLGIFDFLIMKKKPSSFTKKLTR